MYIVHYYVKFPDEKHGPNRKMGAEKMDETE